MPKDQEDAAAKGETVSVGFRWPPGVRDRLTEAAAAQRPRTSANRLAQIIIEEWLDQHFPLKRGKARR